MRLIGFIILWGSIFLASAQSLWQINNYQYDLKLINPALIRANQENSFSFFLKEQWTKIDGNPRTVALTYEHGIDNIESDVGLLFSNSSSAFTSSSRTSLFFAKRLEFSSKSSLKIGTTLAYQTFSIDNTSFRAIDPDDSFIPFGSNTNDEFYIDLGFAYQYGKLLVGGAIQNLFLDGSDDLPISKEHQFYNVYAQYEWDNLHEKIVLKPYMLYQQTDGNWRADTGLDVQFFKLLTLGGRVRSYANESAYLISCSVQLQDWANLSVILYDQSIQQSSEHDILGNNLELGLKVLMPN